MRLVRTPFILKLVWDAGKLVRTTQLGAVFRKIFFGSTFPPLLFSGQSSFKPQVNAAIPRLAVVFAYRGSVPCKCRDFLLLYRDCRGFRLLRERAVQMP